jgi:hypothetical protein
LKVILLLPSVSGEAVERAAWRRAYPRRYLDKLPWFFLDGSPVSGSLWVGKAGFLNLPKLVLERYTHNGPGFSRRSRRMVTADEHKCASRG